MPVEHERVLLLTLLFQLKPGPLVCRLITAPFLETKALGIYHLRVNMSPKELSVNLVATIPAEAMVVLSSICIPSSVIQYPGAPVRSNWGVVPLADVIVTVEKLLPTKFG